MLPTNHPAQLISPQRHALPDLQSFVIVLFKELFQNVQALIVQNGPNGIPNGMSEDGANDGQNKRRTNPNSSANMSGLYNGSLAEDEDGTAPAIESLNEMRSREISSKAVSGILLVLLKWFKLSRACSPLPCQDSDQVALTCYRHYEIRVSQSTPS